MTITINGTNDAAVISGTTAGSVIEAGCATPGTPTATGTLTDTDVDNPPNTFTAVCSPTASDAGYGTFTMTADGVWTYTLDNANSTVQALNVGDTLTDTFTVTTVDGTPQVVTITINGSNDAAIISGTTTGSVIEAGGATPGTPTATGTLTDTDVDNTPNTFTAVAANGERCRLRHLHDDGGRRVDLHARQRQQRGAGAQCRRHADRHLQGDHRGRHPQVVTITIHGTNDAAPNDFWALHGDSFHFKDEIFGHKGSDAIDLAVSDFTLASTSHREDAATSGGLAISGERKRLSCLRPPPTMRGALSLLMYRTI